MEMEVEVQSRVSNEKAAAAMGLRNSACRFRERARLDKETQLRIGNNLPYPR